MRDEIPPQEAFAGLLPDGVARLVVALVRAEQAELIAKGSLPRSAADALADPRSDLRHLRIDEDGLGFDSLARIALVLRLNRFFGLSQTGIEDYLFVRRELGDWFDLVGEHLRRMGLDLTLTFDTSGSSGPVKHLAHPLRRLLSELAAHRAGPLAGPPRRILAMVPPQHIYGCLFTLLLPAQTGAETVDLHRLAPSALARMAKPGDLVIGTPFTWDLVTRTAAALPPDVWGLTSAGPSTAETFAGPSRLGLDRMIEIYGATETGGIATREGFDQNFKLLPHLTRRGCDIFGPDGALDLQDDLHWRDAQYLRPVGRKDDVVQVAGVNVSPGLVCAHLRGVEGVAEAAVRLGEDRLKAFVVAERGVSEADLAARIAAALSALPPPARPSPIRFGTALPRTAMGKLCDWG